MEWPRYLRQGNVIRQVASPYSLCQRFPYAPFNAMVTEISKWSRIQDSFQITPKTESLVACAMPDIPSKFQKHPSTTFWVILITDRSTDKQTNKQTWSGKNITSLVEVIINSICKCTAAVQLRSTTRFIANRLAIQFTSQSLHCDP